MAVVKKVIWINYNIRQVCKLWPELTAVSIEDAIVDQINNDSQPTMVFDRMLIMGPVTKIHKVNEDGERYVDGQFKALVSFIVKNDLSDFELHAVVVDFNEKDGKKIPLVNVVGVYGR